MKKILIYSFIIIGLQSCSLLNRNLCSNFISDETTFRAFSEANSSSSQFAEEKAILLAKKEIAIMVDDYILEKYNHKTFLEDPEYENKIIIARKTILSNIEIVCSKTVEKKGLYKSYVAIEISKSSIDNIVGNKLKEETQ